VDRIIDEYIEINKGFIQHYFVMKSNQGFHCIYISANNPLGLQGDELISDLTKKQIELNVITPLEFKQIANLVGVAV